jgi:uncharacterized protein YndB with AHSA1/START domain
MTPTETGGLTLTTPSDTEVVVTRSFDAPRELVWSAYTEPEHLTQWMGGFSGWTMPVCEFEPVPDKAYRFAWRKDDGEEMEITGVVKEVVPPERLVTTEEWGGDWPEALTTVEFTEADGRTTITTTVVYPTLEARDAALGTGMTDGMATSYDRLETLLARLAG